MSSLRTWCMRALAAMVLLAVTLPASAQPLNDLPNPYLTVENHFEMPPGRTWGATSAVDIDPDGASIWVAERCGANNCAGSDLPAVLRFDADGNLVRSFGAGLFIFPHRFHDAAGNVYGAEVGPRALKKYVTR